MQKAFGVKCKGLLVSKLFGVKCLWCNRFWPESKSLSDVKTFGVQPSGARGFWHHKRLLVYKASGVIGLWSKGLWCETFLVQKLFGQKCVLCERVLILALKGLRCWW